MKDRNIAWHYTIAPYFESIMEDGFILPSSLERQKAMGIIPPDEKPILWFSTHGYWEKSAAKGDGGKGFLSMKQMFQFGSLVRFGADKSLFRPWKQVAADAGMSKVAMRGLVKVGKKLGADPRQWLATLDPVPVERVSIIQAMNLGDREWQTYSYNWTFPQAA